MANRVLGAESPEAGPGGPRQALTLHWSWEEAGKKGEGLAEASKAPPPHPQPPQAWPDPSPTSQEALGGSARPTWWI